MLTPRDSHTRDWPYEWTLIQKKKVHSLPRMPLASGLSAKRPKVFGGGPHPPTNILLQIDCGMLDGARHTSAFVGDSKLVRFRKYA